MKRILLALTQQRDGALVVDEEDGDRGGGDHLDGPPAHRAGQSR